MVLPDNLRHFGKARGPRARRVAFVFQGGGSLAAAQVGTVRALAAAGLRPDLVIGSSAGALNAVAFAADPSQAGADAVEAVWRSLPRRQVPPKTSRALLRPLPGGGAGLVSQSAWRALLAGLPVPRTLDGTSIPAHVVATELASGAPVVISDGETVLALLASCAFPGLYAPVELAGRQLVDGGVSADVPVLQAEALGASVTYVLPAATYALPLLPSGPLPLAPRAPRCRWPPGPSARSSAQ